MTKLYIFFNDINATSLIDCFDGSVISYNGTLNTTISGKTCQRWDSDNPHKPHYRPVARSDHNYCRYNCYVRVDVKGRASPGTSTRGDGVLPNVLVLRAGFKSWVSPATKAAVKYSNRRSHIGLSPACIGRNSMYALMCQVYSNIHIWINWDRSSYRSISETQIVMRRGRGVTQLILLQDGNIATWKRVVSEILSSVFAYHNTLVIGGNVGEKDLLPRCRYFVSCRRRFNE